MKRNFIMFSIVLISTFFFSMIEIKGLTSGPSVDFNFGVRAFGGKIIDIQAWDNEGNTFDLIKIKFTKTSGDNFNLTYAYTDDFPSLYTSLAHTFNDLNNGTYTYYFIPKNGSCPSGANRCIKVPTYGQIVTTDQVAASWALYGFVFYNGSIFGGTLNISGTYTLMNY